MRQFRTHVLISLFSIAALIALMNPAQAQRPRPVPAGDCQQLIASSGGHGIWYGEYSGQSRDISSDRMYPFAGRGCFTSEYACRRWTNEMLSAANGSPGLTSCRPYR